MKLALPPIPETERTPLVVALLATLDAQQLRIVQLEETVQLLRDEINVLKGQQPRPKIAPSTLDKPPPQPALAPDEQRPGSAKCAKTAAFVNPVEVTIPFPDPPPGATRHGYEDYFVQELVVEAQVTHYRRERIVTPDGQTLLAPLPNDVLPGSHFGPLLQGYIIYQYRHGHVTQPLLLEQLHEFGMDMSTGELSRLLTENHEAFPQEKAAILTAGLTAALYSGVDDTGARHAGHHGYGTAIGNDRFAYCESTASKSRLNFLQGRRGAAAG